MLGILARRHLALAAGIVSVGLLLGGCSDGTDGADGTPGTSTATVGGMVTNSSTGAPIAGVAIATDPVVPGVSLVTDATGAYSGDLPIGPYMMSCAATNFEDQDHDVSVVAGVPLTCDFDMDPVAPVVLAISGAPSGPVPGDTFGLTVTATIMDGSANPAYQWTQSASAQANIQNPTSATATITLGDTAAYKAELLSHLDDHERWMVQGVSPYAIEEAGHVAFTVDVTTTSGTYTESVDIHTALPFVTTNPGLGNVPLGKVVYLQGKTQPTYDWALAGPGAATIQDGTTRNPWFTPDATGTWTVTVTDLGEMPAVVETLTLEAGTWEGGLTGIGSDGKPDLSCAACHNGPVGAISTDYPFVDKWRATGHAHILENNINFGGHYGTYCFPCHTVGYDPAVNNGGIDDASDYAAMTADLFPGGSSHADPNNWNHLVTTYPASAQLAQIQCENCHGPNTSALHMNGSVDDQRVSLSSDVCATCHGEPPRHGRFQQWEESGHSNYELAIEESEGFRGFCSKCHSANGFMKWLPRLTDGDPGNDTGSPTVILSAEEIHPQTCQVCHDPHDVGTTAGHGTNAPMRIQGDTPALMSGFTALSVGKGAMCMTCHNGRRGLRNDSTWEDTKGENTWPVGDVWQELDDGEPDVDGDPARATHGGPQTDVVMGQNAYFTEIGFRGPHGLISNTCVNCHMELTDPPAELSYNLGGTNHNFEASEEICSECHGGFTAENVEELIERTMHGLEEALIAAIKDEIGRQLALGNYVQVEGIDDEDEDVGNDIQVEITDISDVEEIHLTESHGRQAMDIRVNGQWVYHTQLEANVEIYDDAINPDVLVPVYHPGDDVTYDVDLKWPGLTRSTGGEVIARAGWNYWLAHSDGSHGIHNPSFLGEALEAALAVLAEEFGS